MANCDNCDTEDIKLGPDGATGSPDDANASPSLPVPSKRDQAASTQPAKFLQLMAQWLDGAGDPANDLNKESLYRSWNGRYDEDSEEEIFVVPDMAPVLGLPSGTAPEELSRVAAEQEDDLIQQLISQA